MQAVGGIFIGNKMHDNACDARGVSAHRANRQIGLDVLVAEVQDEIRQSNDGNGQPFTTLNPFVVLVLIEAAYVFEALQLVVN